MDKVTATVKQETTTTKKEKTGPFDASDRAHALQNVRCLLCGSLPGKPCTNREGSSTNSHVTRLRAARNELNEGVEVLEDIESGKY